MKTTPNSCTRSCAPSRIALHLFWGGTRMIRSLRSLYLGCCLSLVASHFALAISIDTVPVGNVGNSNDPATGSLYGGVGAAYSIGKYEVTVGQYSAFLNAVAAADTYSLYSPFMATDINEPGIARSGSPGSYTYSPIASPNYPVAGVSWGNAARFANWLHNGQPVGPQNSSTTEAGAYSLNGATSQTALMAVTRSPGAKWFIPTENEWYKAAYHQPAAAGGDSDDYWAYPMKNNAAPYSDPPPGTTPDNSRVGNFYYDDVANNGYNDGFAVNGMTWPPSSSQTYVTDVGAYTSSPSYYGTFDQGGNMYEWNETVVTAFSRGVRGGSWATSPSDFSASSRLYNNPTVGNANGYAIGFRVATVVPEPGTLAIAVMASTVLFLLKKRAVVH
jgi:sulfatase modifying factor 1